MDINFSVCRGLQIGNFVCFIITSMHVHSQCIRWHISPYSRSFLYTGQTFHFEQSRLDYKSDRRWKVIYIFVVYNQTTLHSYLTGNKLPYSMNKHHFFLATWLWITASLHKEDIHLIDSDIMSNSLDSSPPHNLVIWSGYFDLTWLMI
jgi:hypothetical protein